MKKFSIAALIVLSTLSSAPVVAALKSKCEFLPNAPDQHVVVRGDTLWGISGKFLEHPWCWPQVWGMNREQIRNPHWIYPGQVIVLDRVAGRLRLAKPLAEGAGSGSGEQTTVRLSPRVRVSDVDKDAIPAIAASVIEPFLTQAVILEKDEMAGVPRIVAAQENHVNIGNGDKAYVMGDLKGQTRFQAFRSPIPLKDPVTGEIIGYEARHVGVLRLTRASTAPDEAHVFTVASVREEMGVGDRLLPVPESYVLSYAPHAPEKPVFGRVASIYSGVTHAGQNNVVSINLGKADGIDPGTVLKLFSASKIIADRTDGKRKVTLPAEEYGTLFVFRVFNRVSYGLIMQVTDSVVVGDEVRAPE